MTASICVYCSSSDRLDRSFYDLAREVGEKFAARRLTLVYGGGGVGMMGAAARAASASGGKVIGVIPEFMKVRELAFEEADEMVVTATMRERKAAMIERSDAFLILPGGFGTLEEAMEVLTLKQLDIHRKPIVFLNAGGFFDPLFSFFDALVDQHFSRALYRNLYRITETVDESLDYIEGYRFDAAEIPWYVTT